MSIGAGCHDLDPDVLLAARPGLSDQPAAGKALTEWRTCGAVQVAGRWWNGSSPCKAGLP